MLGLTEIWRILRRLGDASLLLCGDPAQLPPISPGVVFHALAVGAEVSTVVLDRVHRQSESSGIPQIAEGVRNGSIPGLPTFAGAKPGVTFTPCRLGQLGEEVVRIRKALLDAGAEDQDIQVVSPTNAEVDAINWHMHGLHLKTGPELWPSDESTRAVWQQEPLKEQLIAGICQRSCRLHLS